MIRLTVDVDPIELELTRNLFEAAAEEMGITLQRVAFSANIKERRDFSCAIFDAGRRTARAGGPHPRPPRLDARVRGGGAGAARRAAARATSRSSTTRSPAARTCRTSRSSRRSTNRDDLIGYAANRAHHADVGGTSPGSMTLSRHIDEEGAADRAGAAVPRGACGTRRCSTRSSPPCARPPSGSGDLDAQLAANHVGAEALRRMVAPAGRARSSRTTAGRCSTTRPAFMARAIDAIPDGTYAFEDAMDDDGAGVGPDPDPRDA